MRRTRIVFALLALAVNGLAQGAPTGTPGASPVATPQSDVAGVAPLPLTGERRAAFEACIAGALAEFRIPGAAVAVVQNGEAVYLNGFGVKQLGSTQPVTPDTMMIAPRPAPLSGVELGWLVAIGSSWTRGSSAPSCERGQTAGRTPPSTCQPASPTGPEQVYVFEPVDAAQPSVD